MLQQAWAMKEILHGYHIRTRRTLLRIIQCFRHLLQGDRVNIGPVLLYFENRSLIRLRRSFEQRPPEGLMFLQIQCRRILPPLPLQDHSSTPFPVYPKCLLYRSICLTTSNSSRVRLALSIFKTTICLGGLISFTTW